MRHVDPHSLAAAGDRPETDLFGAPTAAWRTPIYPRLAQLDDWRRLANSAKGLTDAESRAYGRAVLAAINALNGAARHPPISLKSTAWTAERQRAEHVRQLHAAVNADRARRTDAEIVDAYEEAMKIKRTALDQRDATARRGKALMPAAATIQVLFAGSELEHDRAKAWRQRQGLTRAALAERTGFSASQIQDYEEGGRRGKAGPSAEISEAAWLRYRLACAAIEAGLPDAW